MTGCAIDILTHTLYHLDTYYYNQLFNSTWQYCTKIFVDLKIIYLFNTLDYHYIIAPMELPKPHPTYNFCLSISVIVKPLHNYYIMVYSLEMGTWFETGTFPTYLITHRK